MAAATTIPTVAAAAALPALDPQRPQSKILSDALVLSGGGARGAFQAGLICALAQAGGVADGTPLRPYGLVCGSSIGTLNAWFVSTGQYTALRKAWATIADANVFALKRKYAAIIEPDAFAGAKLYEYMHLALAVTRHEQAIGQSAPILEWMRGHIDPSMPVLTPMVWATTNMTTQAGEYFYRLPPDMSTQLPNGVKQALEASLGAATVIRPASDDILHRALLASAAVPVLLDPVALPMTDGTDGLYIDGSIASNAAVSIARVVASNVDVILVDAKSTRAEYPNAIAVAFGAYATMQRDILETAMRDNAFERPSRIRFVRPDTPLASDIRAFREQNVIDTMFALGEKAAAIGFSPYDWQTFHL
jgi:predicted acylesterase/phospholipase RssA